MKKHSRIVTVGIANVPYQTILDIKMVVAWNVLTNILSTSLFYSF
jgi:hypothetical protein